MKAIMYLASVALAGMLTQTLIALRAVTVVAQSRHDADCSDP
jgi:hypothetical protein